MKKVMLIDDEILVRESIRECIDWTKEGFLYCGDAPDGEVALPMIEQLRPDIIITDIKMPFMNGLELSSIVRSRMPEIKIIILSGHDEFEYARAALRAGVEEYCLKPVSSADIIRMLQETSKKIDQERFEQERILELQQAHGKNTAQDSEKLLADLCSGLITTADAILLASSLSLPLSANHYAVGITDVRCQRGTAQLDRSIIAQAEELLGERIASIGEHLHYKRSHTETIWLFKGRSEAELESSLLHFHQNMYAVVKPILSCSLTVGLGTVQDRLQGIHTSYLEAEDDKHWRRIARQSQLALLGAAASPGHTLSTHPFDRQRFIDFLKLGNPKHTLVFVDSLAEELQAIDWKGTLYGCYLLNDLAIEALRIAKAMSRSLYIPEQFEAELQQSLSAIRRFDDARQFLIKLLGQFWIWRNDSTDKYADMLNQVKDYIQKHYHDDRLSLQDAAEFACVSVSHLSKVFSQETGQTFIEYVTHTRIRRAMELLKATNAKTYEIAHLVGYNDAHYFSHLFKRITGATTSQYRKDQAASSVQSSYKGAIYAHNSIDPD
ncbi:hypothetical protein BK133_13430 [Paenibacillus sp. FSL H8-0548]|uniref:response regulator n=1 Tax=Paenibacillus sp. FSL H8-0548 TaxID=1920422 RepID=UPI00096CD363|nr:response regulator [Paenibacillus sp. FSL H8-0548]OMF33788.1 hypothetical protein BK133_13430 [Paenibacillus sp. FSL H8-0548]